VPQDDAGAILGPELAIALSICGRARAIQLLERRFAPLVTVTAVARARSAVIASGDPSMLIVSIWRRRK